MTIESVYDRYHIMPNLRLHQKRVAAVASLLCEHIGLSPEEKEHAVAACLLHDMGNILKFDLDRQLFPLSQDEKQHWKEVQEKYRETYGDNEHIATNAIVKELGVAPSVQILADHVGFRNIPEVCRNGTLLQQIVCYADMRVAPHGVVSLSERFADFQKRYAQKNLLSPEETKKCTDAFFEIEKNLFSKTDTTPESISDGSIASTLATFEGYRFATGSI